MCEDSADGLAKESGYALTVRSFGAREHSRGAAGTTRPSKLIRDWRMSEMFCNIAVVSGRWSSDAL